MSSEAQGVRVRFAPSPTGTLHIGGLRTALYNFLFARHHGGTLVLRIEDTDRDRFVEDAEAYIVESMAWCGMSYDEGPDGSTERGRFGPYRQSERKALYHEHIRTLLDKGHAYYAFDTRDELDAMRERLVTEQNPAPRYDATTRLEMTNAFTLSESEVQERINRGDPYVVRLHVPQGETVQFTDLVRGTVVFSSDEIDDQILIKSDGMPTYHFANVVDDHFMEITHIIRGEEWLPSTPKHILLYQFFGWTPPEMAHLPLILSPTGGKLSKRKADKMGIPTNVLEYRDLGYEPEALVNFLAFLGWNPGTEQEIFSLDELVQAFTVDRVGSAGAQFDMNKLDWFNQQYLKSLPIENLVSRLQPLLAEAGISADQEHIEAAAILMQDRMTQLKDFLNDGVYFFEDPTSYAEKAVKKRWKEDTGALLMAYGEQIDALVPYEAGGLEETLKTFVSSREIGLGKLMAPLRLAVSGVAGGPDLYAMMALLGKDTVLRRIEAAVQRLG